MCSSDLLRTQRSCWRRSSSRRARQKRSSTVQRRRRRARDGPRPSRGRRRAEFESRSCGGASDRVQPSLLVAGVLTPHLVQLRVACTAVACTRGSIHPSVRVARGRSARSVQCVADANCTHTAASVLRARYPDRFEGQRERDVAETVMWRESARERETHSTARKRLDRLLTRRV